MKHAGSDNKPKHEINAQDLIELATVIKREKDTLLSRWRDQVRQLPSAKHLNIPTLNDHVPVLIEELAYALQSRSDDKILKAPLGDSPPLHGAQRFEHNFDIVEVVAEYNILRGCIYDLAEENGLNLHGKAFHILSRVFDEAIGVAVQTFVTQQALEIQRRRDEHLGFIVHDLRTPLNAISLAVKILEFTPPEESGQKITQMLTILSRNIKRLEALVEKVLKESTYVQAETAALERREFDLWPLVESLIYDLGPLAKTGGTKVTNRISKELAVYADAGMLRRVFQNLLSNALRYTPRGEIIIDARKKDAGDIECRVSDNGTGIPKDRLERIFDKAETNLEKTEKTTTGLGLPIVKALVEAHGGEVEVESREGAGSTFRFTLPLKQKDENR
ncbi:MAG TPA: sensor histidine kinase [Gammaproteobacteria bacterium]